MPNPSKNKAPTKPAGSNGATKPNGQPPKISATVDGGLAGANRKERKEEARRQREVLMRKRGRRRTTRFALVGGAAIVVLAAVLFFTLRGNGSSTSSSPPASTFDQANLPGLMTGQATSQWTANATELPARVTDLGLPALTASEQLAFHIHQNVQIFIDGKPVQIPAYIGIDTIDQKISVIHTHGTDGVAHVESPVQRVFTLRDFFGVWGLNFTPTSIGGFENGDGKSLQVYLNGALYPGDPTTLPLKNHEVIVVTYGTPQELPNPIPSTFNWAGSSAGG